MVHPIKKNDDGSPFLFPKLTSYQHKIWMDGFRYKYRLTIKSQKVGLSTSQLMEDFQRAILPRSHPLSCRGYEILIIGQSFSKAKDHIRDLRQWILSSEKYKDFLILKPEDPTMNEESSKTMLYINNPEEPTRPTRIIATSIESEASIWSWKRVKFIHMSDVAAAEVLDDSGAFAAAFSRLANTGGGMHIETPPRGQIKKVWEIYQQSELGSSQRTLESQFKINKVYASQAVDAGLMTQEFLDAERERLGPAYGGYYEADFLNSSNTFYSSDLFNFDNEEILG